MSEQAKVYGASVDNKVGFSIMRYVQAAGRINFITRAHAELDLTNHANAQNFFKGKGLIARTPLISPNLHARTLWFGQHSRC